MPLREEKHDEVLPRVLLYARKRYKMPTRIPELSRVHESDLRLASFASVKTSCLLPPLMHARLKEKP